MNREQSVLARRVRQVSTGPPPPSLHSYIGWLQNSIVKTSRKTKFRQNYFAKFKENFAKQEIKNLAKILGDYKNEHFRSHPKPTQSALCYTPSPPVC